MYVTMLLRLSWVFYLGIDIVIYTTLSIKHISVNKQYFLVGTTVYVGLQRLHAVRAYIAHVCLACFPTFRTMRCFESRNGLRHVLTDVGRPFCDGIRVVKRARARAQILRLKRFKGFLDFVKKINAITESLRVFFSPF